MTIATSDIEKLRKSLRLADDEFDDEITRGVEFTFGDLVRVGVPEPDLADPLIFRLAELSLKASFNFEQEGERYGKAYTQMRNGLSLSEGYKEAESDV